MDAIKTEYDANLDQLAESFSSDVINDAISEIIAEDNDKLSDEVKWYRQRRELTPTVELLKELSEAEHESVSSESISGSTLTQMEQNASLEKVSPILTPRSWSTGETQSTSGRYDDELPTSDVLKDIPGYISPNTREKLLNSVRFDSEWSNGLASNIEDDYGKNEDPFRTIECENMEDTIHEQPHSARKSSVGSYSSGVDDRSSKSNSCQQRSEGSSVGSTTVFHSIASGVFSHKKHMSPLLDVSDRSVQQQRASADGGAVQRTSPKTGSSKSSPRDIESKTSGSFKLDSPRELHSQLSSATEYETLPHGRRDSTQSPNMTAHLMLSPDLAERVSNILSQSSAPRLTKLTFSEGRPLSSLETSATSSPRESARGKLRVSNNTSTSLSQDELDEHVSNVLSHSMHVLESNNSPNQRFTEPDDHSHLDKYMSPQNCSAERFRIRLSPSGSMQQSSPGQMSSESTPRAYSVERVTSAISPALSDHSDGQINRKYMDKSSREVLEQAAEEYYKTRSKSDAWVDNSKDSSHNKNDSGLSHTSHELAHLVDSKPSPTGPPTLYTNKPKMEPVRAVSEADTQSLVAKRLDRIEFMVLSALNEVPPQSRPSYIEPADYTKETISHTNVSPVAANMFDSRDLIKKSEVRSPLAHLPDYTLDELPAGSRRPREESFNVSISPVRKEPFTAFNRAHELLAERLTQRSNERTPGRKLSARSNAAYDKSSPMQSSVRNSSPPYLSTDSRLGVHSKSKERIGRGRGLENIPEPLPLKIEEAGRSPSDDLIQRRRAKGKSHSVCSLDSVTTIESSHPESDDAQPPVLPKEAFGSRQEPLKSTPGIYGTRSSKVKSSDSELTPRATSAIGRAEEVLLRGEQIRGEIQARCEDRSKRLNVSPKDDTGLPRSSAGSIALNQSDTRYERSADIVDESAVDVRDKDVPLDFYTPPRPSRGHSRHRRGDTEDSVQRHEVDRPREAWAKKADVARQHCERLLGNATHDNFSPLDKSARTNSFEGRSLVESVGLSRGFDKAKSSPPRSPRLDTSSVPQVTRDSLRSSANEVRHRGVRPLERPLERIDHAEAQDLQLRSKLSHAVSDRLSTYHILREELMKAENDAKGQDLNLAWQRIRKRKPKASLALDESNSTTATSASTSAASSEAFDESKMNKLKSLLNNPLGHLVSKVKKHKSRKEESLSTHSLSTTTMTSNDETFCSRCDEKRTMKRAMKKFANTSQQQPLKTRKGNNRDGVAQTSDGCSTRPVTPTGLPLPCIQPQQHTEHTPQSAASLRKEKRLKDVGVMFPTPSVETTKAASSRKQKNKPPSPQKPDDEALPENESVTWFIGDKRDGDKRPNTFQKSKSKDTAHDGLVWCVPFSNPRPWTKCPKERKAFSVSKEPWPPTNETVETAAQRRRVNDICDTFKEATGRVSYVPTLQEAFRERNRRFISSSRERQRRINLRAEERQITKVHDEQRGRLFDIQPHSYRPMINRRRDVDDNQKRVIPKEEMYDRTSRKYRVLPEVMNREKQSAIRQERVAYRIKAKLFNKKVQRHVLDQARITNMVGNRKSLQKRSKETP